MAQTDNARTVLAIVAGVVAVFVTVMVMVLVMIMRERRVNYKMDSYTRELDEVKAGLAKKRGRNDVTNALEPFKKHLLQSAFDLQSRLHNQVNANFLHEFYTRSPRDREYAAYSTAYFFAEFLAWLEVVRQRVVFVTGSEYAEQLNCLIEAIKFQFTGETPIQGCAPKHVDVLSSGDFYDSEAVAMQLYIVDIRSIGNAMLRTSSGDGQGGSDLPTRPISCDEFIKHVSSDCFPSVTGRSGTGTSGRVPTRCAADETEDAGFQRTMSPLTDAINHLASLPMDKAPKKRLAMLQVLLCKLIDILDSSVPWDLGPKFDAEEEPRYIQRDIRLTPGVKHLSPLQVQNLSQQSFFSSDPNVSFPGFREDLGHKSQHERDDALWLGACPPREPRRRDVRWVQQFRYSQGAASGLGSGGVRRRPGQRAVDAGAPMPTDASTIPGARVHTQPSATPAAMPATGPAVQAEAMLRRHSTTLQATCDPRAATSCLPEGPPRPAGAAAAEDLRSSPSFHRPSAQQSSTRHDSPEGEGPGGRCSGVRASWRGEESGQSPSFDEVLVLDIVQEALSLGDSKRSFGKQPAKLLGD